MKVSLYQKVQEKKNVVYKIEGRGELHSKRKNSFGEELSEEEAEDILFKEIPPPPTNQSPNQDCIRCVCWIQGSSRKFNCSHNDSVCCNQRNVENLDVTALI
ncbi:hypothetical protein P8452_38521 [Trifolium repens]|nr:hypothetical protein P8452_38521 [Trifolium repens]